MSCRFALSAAGFMATRTFGASPGVTMSWSEMWTWNDDTPAIVPAGARISAGKFGRVARSLPKMALASVKRSPAICMPSPESPAKRMTTSSMSIRSGPTDVVSAVTSLTPLCGAEYGITSWRTKYGRHAPSDSTDRSFRSRDRASSERVERGVGLLHRRVEPSPLARAADELGLDVDARTDAAGPLVEAAPEPPDHHDGVAGLQRLDPGGRVPDRDRDRGGAVVPGG